MAAQQADVAPELGEPPARSRVSSPLTFGTTDIRGQVTVFVGALLCIMGH